MSEKLKPCPFCGGSNISVMFSLTQAYVECGDCMATVAGWRSTPESTGDVEAIAAWNRRLAPKSVTREAFSELCGELSTMNFSDTEPVDVVRWAERKFSELGISVEDNDLDECIAEFRRGEVVPRPRRKPHD